jgi:outer membrane protein
MNYRSLIALILWMSLHPNGWTADGLELTQEQAIAMALSKNFNIQINEINPEIQKQRIQQEKGAFDPTLEVSYSDSVDVSDSDDEHSESFETTVGGKLPFGTTYKLGLNASKEDSETTMGSHSSFAGITLTQSLLKDFGLNANWAFVRIADRQHKMAEWELKQTALDVILNVVLSYNNYFLAQQNAEVAKRNRDLAEQLVSDNRKRIEQGMLSPVDIAVAEAEVAVREERVLRSTGNLKIQENNLKNLIFSDYRTVVATKLLIDELPQAIEPITDLMKDFETALERQPDLKIKQISREIEQLQLDRAINQQMPDLSVHASYGFSGYGDSIGNSIDQLGRDDSFNYSVGLSMSYPIPNRGARANTAISRLNLRQMDLGIEQVKQEIMLNLHSTIVLVETNWNRIQASRKARELSNQMLLAEQKKLQAGTSSTFVVLRLQNDVANAQIQEFQTISDYNISLAQYARLKGML